MVVVVAESARDDGGRQFEELLSDGGGDWDADLAGQGRPLLGTSIATSRLNRGVGAGRTRPVPSSRRTVCRSVSVQRSQSRSPRSWPSKPQREQSKVWDAGAGRADRGAVNGVKPGEDTVLAAFWAGASCSDRAVRTGPADVYVRPGAGLVSALTTAAALGHVPAFRSRQVYPTLRFMLASRSGPGARQPRWRPDAGAGYGCGSPRKRRFRWTWCWRARDRPAPGRSEDPSRPR